jgi:hypothetical protein
MRIQSRYRRLLTSCTAAFALAVSACLEPTATRTPVDGLFVLRTIGADPLPAVTSTVLNTQFIALADTITLRADGSGESRSTTVRRNLLTDERDTTSIVLRFTYQRRGERVRATDIICEPLCEAVPDWAEYVLDGEWLNTSPGTIARLYERVGSAPAL